MLFTELSNGGCIIVLDEKDRNSLKKSVSIYRELYEATHGEWWKRYRIDEPNKPIHKLEDNL